MFVSTLFVVDFFALDTGFEIVIKLIRLLAVKTLFCVEFLESTFKTQFVILSDFSSVIILIYEEFFIVFSLFFFHDWTAAFVHVTSTSFDATITANLMTVTFLYATVILHTMLAVKVGVAVPIMVVTEVLSQT